MIRLSANLSVLFTETPLAERFAAAAAAGFQAVECQFPYALPAQEARERLDRSGLQLVLINAPAGDMARGDRGIAGLPDRVGEYRRGVAVAADWLRTTGCRRLHVMPGKVPQGYDAQQCRAAFIDNLAFTADVLAGDGVTVMVEPINTRVDVPGYLIETTSQALECIAAADRPNIRLQYDVYHMQIMEGDVARSIQRLLPHIGHIQIADNPGRHEPGTGEINFPWLLEHIDSLGYEGYIGCEYLPATSTRDSLSWARKYLAR